MYSGRPLIVCTASLHTHSKCPPLRLQRKRKLQKTNSVQDIIWCLHEKPLTVMPGHRAWPLISKFLSCFNFRSCEAESYELFLVNHCCILLSYYWMSCFVIRIFSYYLSLYIIADNAINSLTQYKYHCLVYWYYLTRKLFKMDKKL